MASGNVKLKIEIPSSPKAIENDVATITSPIVDNSRSQATMAADDKAKGVCSKVWGHFLTLKTAPRELWLVYVLKLLESYAYFSFAIIFTIYLTNEVGFTDLEAGLLYGMYGTLTSVYGLFMGFVVDNLGVRRSLILGSALCAIGRFVLTFSKSTFMIKAMLYSLLPMGTALAIPVMSLGIRRYTNDSNRSFAFSLFYTVMNVAALFSGWVIDLMRRLQDTPDHESQSSGQLCHVLGEASSTQTVRCCILPFNGQTLSSTLCH
mmetsp:Transcript_80935/g.142749  ORF Transcript_80935/g.142749 Transcript_80935/m.142749 type:complete len:263 (-) Transcript_80935:124-912(-)